MYKLPSLNNKTIDCPIFIATSNSFLPLLRPFSFLFNKFWSNNQKVTFLGYEEPDFKLPNNFDFISLGTQKGIQFWSDDLRPIIENVKHDYFIYTAEDQFLTKHVNFKSLDSLVTEAYENNPARISLTNTVSNQKNTLLNDENIIRANQNAEYRLSLIWSIWRKDYFLSHLKENYSPWDFEIKNMKSSKFDSQLIVGCNKSYPIGHCNAVQTIGNTENFNYDECKLNLQDVTTHPTDKSKRKYLDKQTVLELLNLKYISPNHLKG